MSQQKKLELPARLREFRGRANWSQQELADWLGVSGNYISMIELGKKLPGPSLRKLFESLERSALPAAEIPVGMLTDAPLASPAPAANTPWEFLSTELLIQNFVEFAEKLPLGGVPEKKWVAGNLREMLEEIERRLLASSGALSEAQQIAVRAARPGGRPGTK